MVSSQNRVNQTTPNLEFTQGNHLHFGCTF